MNDMSVTTLITGPIGPGDPDLKTTFADWPIKHGDLGPDVHHMVILDHGRGRRLVVINDGPQRPV